MKDKVIEKNYKFKKFLKNKKKIFKFKKKIFEIRKISQL